MDGLEAVEIKLSRLEFTRRIDSEYYRKIFIENEKLLLSNKHFSLYEISHFLIGPFGSAFTVDNYTEDTTYRYIRGKDVKPFNLQDNDNVFMPKSDFERLKKYALKQNDILLSVVGTLGNSAIITDENLPAIFSCKSTVIRDSIVNPFFLLTYLNTTIIRDLLLRKTRGAVQLGLNLDDLKTIPVADFSESFQKSIEIIYMQSRTCLKAAKGLYNDAESLLLSHLGLDTYTPNSCGIAVKSFKESFGITGRLDSEYYQPKYDDVEKILKSKGYDLLENMCELINYGTVPTSPYTEDGSGIPYIKGMNLKNTQITGELDRIENTEGLSDRFYSKEGDIIISQMGTVGDVGVVKKEEENMIFASFAIRARLKKDCGWNPLYVGLYIQNIAKKWYLSRNIAQASVRQNTDLPTIRNMYIPKLSEELQIQIAVKTQQSFTLRKKSAELLELAKTAVEVAIEQGEDKAKVMLEGVE